MTKRAGFEIETMAGSLGETQLSRRACLGGAAAIGFGVLGLAVTQASAQTMMKQADVKYQDTPKGADKCSGCALFKAPDACTSVEGKISPEGWCSIYAPKA